MLTLPLIVETSETIRLRSCFPKHCLASLEDPLNLNGRMLAAQQRVVDDCAAGQPAAIDGTRWKDRLGHKAPKRSRAN